MLPLRYKKIVYVYTCTDNFGITTTHTAVQILISTITVSAESVVDSSTPAARVSWRTTIPPQCIASVTVEFRTSSRGPVVANYTTTNSSQSEVIKNGLQCTTYYYIRVVVTGEASGIHVTLSSRQVRVWIGGKMHF